MNSSLRDQLLAAGLVTQKQARQAEHQERQRKRDYRKQPTAAPARAQPSPAELGRQAHSLASPPSSLKSEVQQAQAAKAARDKALNRRREDKAVRKARIAQIEQIVEQHRLPRLETEDYYSFIDGKKIRRMSVDAQRREQLTQQVLKIVRYKGHYAVVPAEIAERIRERDENMVVPYVQPPKAPDVDEAYKDYVVPDDLMW